MNRSFIAHCHSTCFLPLVSGSFQAWSPRFTTMKQAEDSLFDFMLANIGAGVQCGGFVIVSKLHPEVHHGQPSQNHCLPASPG